jgi:transposase-like protein
MAGRAAFYSSLVIAFALDGRQVMAKRDLDLIDLGLEKHEIECPLCKKQTIHNWPGKIILFAQAKCTHCAGQFLIAMNQPRLEVVGSSLKAGARLE